MKAERTEFADGMIVVSQIHPPINDCDVVIEMHRDDHRVAFITATRAEVRGWVEDLTEFVKGFPIRGGDCPQCDDCGVPDGPAQLTRCGHEGCKRCGGR